MSSANQYQAPRLAVVICDSANEVVVRLQGDGGHLQAAELDRALLPLRARRLALVTFDLAELQFISSLVLGILVGFHRSSIRVGGRVRVISLRPNVREVFEKAGLKMLLQDQQTGDEITNPCLVCA